jgi:hypothetical protein
MPEHAALSPEVHADLRIRTDRSAALGDNVMSCLVVPTEFRRVQDEYPILFRLTPERDRYLALALFGLETGENLFLTDGRWDASYLPLAMDIQPFLIGQAAPNDPTRQVHVDLASPRIDRSGEGVRLFDASGGATPYLEAVSGKLGALDHGLQAADGFFAALDRHQLLQPMTLEVTLANGDPLRLVGYHGIDEERLRALDPAAIADLHGAGHLMPIFMALASLGRIQALVARRSRQAANG